MDLSSGYTSFVDRAEHLLKFGFKTIKAPYKFLAFIVHLPVHILSKVGFGPRKGSPSYLRDGKDVFGNVGGVLLRAKYKGYLNLSKEDPALVSIPIVEIH